MNALLELSPDEVRIANKIGAVLTERAKHTITLESLVRHWMDFVVEVEYGYVLTIWDYTNDLSTRDILRRVMFDVPPVLSEKIRAAIAPWDKRFNEATREVERPLGSGVTKEREPWWFRVPKRLSDELPSDRETWKGIVD